MLCLVLYLLFTLKWGVWGEKVGFLSLVSGKSLDFFKWGLRDLGFGLLGRERNQQP